MDKKQILLNSVKCEEQVRNSMIAHVNDKVHTGKKQPSGVEPAVAYVQQKKAINSYMGHNGSHWRQQKKYMSRGNPVVEKTAPITANTPKYILFNGSTTLRCTKPERSSCRVSDKISRLSSAFKDYSPASPKKIARMTHLPRRTK